MRKGLAIAAIWISLAILNAGFLNANIRGSAQDFSCYYTEYMGRREFGMSLLFSIIPVTWVMMPFLTGFYYYGWSLDYGALENCKT